MRLVVTLYLHFMSFLNDVSLSADRMDTVVQSVTWHEMHSVKVKKLCVTHVLGEHTLLILHIELLLSEMLRRTSN